MATYQVKLLYDGACPFCRREIQWLKRRDCAGSLAMEDISDPAFDPGPYGLTKNDVVGALHGVCPDGRVVRGLEALRQAYQAIGLGWLVAPTGWPLIGWVFDRCYEAFSRNRIRLGKVFRTRERNCACVVADGVANPKRTANTRKSAPHNWIRDADRLTLLPRKR